MLKAFEKIRHFGVFNAYARPKDIEDFSELNLIYGWNYSGKTTLSRVLRTIEKKSLHPDYSKAEFEISTDGGPPITESSLSTATQKVRVFNSDFVKENLSWDGKALEPILLLGAQSIEAQKKISNNEKLLNRVRKGHSRKDAKIAKKKERVGSQEDNPSENHKTSSSIS